MNTEFEIGSRIETSYGDLATVKAIGKYTGGKTKLFVKWDDSPLVVQGRTISYHIRYGNSVWASDVTPAKA